MIIICFQIKTPVQIKLDFIYWTKLFFVPFERTVCFEVYYKKYKNLEKLRNTSQISKIKKIPNAIQHLTLLVGQAVDLSVIMLNSEFWEFAHWIYLDSKLLQLTMIQSADKEISVLQDDWNCVLQLKYFV